MKKGLELYSAYDYDKGLFDIADTLKAVGALDHSSGKAGVMGFCMGGLLTFWCPAAARGMPTRRSPIIRGRGETYRQSSGCCYSDVDASRRRRRVHF